MNKRCPEIIVICSEIETSLERKMKTPSDFDFLSGAIWECIHEYISPTTLKRTWGYIGGVMTIRNSTLNILARFAGYNDWDNFMEALRQKSEIESGFMTCTSIDARVLNVGSCIEVSWLPNRHCIFRLLGECHFEVIKSENTKLKVGDTFDAVLFSEGEPLYLSNLCQDSMEPVSYLCGNKNGLTEVTLLLR